jgi:hypothetical protein
MLGHGDLFKAICQRVQRRAHFRAVHRGTVTGDNQLRFQRGELSLSLRRQSDRAADTTTGR